MRIPFMRLDRQFDHHRDELMATVEAVFSHGQVLQGPEVLRLEYDVAELVGVRHAVAVNCATDALYLALLAAGLKPGDRVAVPALTFVASASAIVRAGGVPVFVDIGEGYQPDVDALARMVKDRAIAGVVAVHLFGQMADLRDLLPLAREHGVFLVEDAAQALGSSRYGANAGTQSDMACISFDPTKVIGAFGSGGMVVTDSDAHAERLRRLRYHGKNADGVFEEIGINSQMPSAQAAVLSTKLAYLDEWIARRIEIAGRYSAALNATEVAEPPVTLPGSRHAYSKYVARVGSRRDEFMAYLADHGIGAAVHYLAPLHRQPCFAPFVEAGTTLPRVESAVREIVSLPIYPELTDDEVDYIADHVARFPW